MDSILSEMKGAVPKMSFISEEALAFNALSNGRKHISARLSTTDLDRQRQIARILLSDLIHGLETVSRLQTEGRNSDSFKTSASPPASFPSDHALAQSSA